MLYVLYIRYVINVYMLYMYMYMYMFILHILGPFMACTCFRRPIDQTHPKPERQESNKRERSEVIILLYYPVGGGGVLNKKMRNRSEVYTLNIVAASKSL